MKNNEKAMRSSKPAATVNAFADGMGNTMPNTMTGWHPFLRPVARLLVAAQLAMLLQPLGALAQTTQPAPTPPSVGRVAAPISSDVSIQDLELRLRDARELVANLQSLSNGATDAQRAAWSRQLHQQLNAALATTSALRLSLFVTGNDQGLLNGPAAGQPSAQLAQQARQTFNAAADALNKAVKPWLTTPTTSNLADLAAFFAQYDQAGAKLAATHNQLPWGTLTAKPRPPAETKAAVAANAAPAQTEGQGGGALDTKVNGQGITTIAGLQFTTPPDASQAPTDADVAATSTVVLNAAIRAKAAELGNNPVTITNWVRNTVAFAPNAGLTQNAATTLTALRGNVADIATRHIALLRAAGIPARYQSGTIEVPATQLQNWLGGLQRPEAALALLQQGGIAARGITTGGQITSIRMEHTWVSAYVNWIPSRGAKDGGATLTPRQHPNPNASLNAWVPLDGAYKPVTYSAGTNMAELAPLNGPALFGRVKQGATCTPATANSLTVSALANSYTDFNTQVGNQLGVLGSNASVTQILGIGSITPRQQALLAGTLPYATVVANTPTAALADSQSWTLQLNVLNGVNAIFAAQRPIADLQGQTLSLAFVPVTSTDATTLSGLLRPATASNGTTIDPATGLPTRIPAYLAQLKAQVSLNGQVVAEGGSFTLGQSLVLRSVLTGPDGAQLSSDNSLVVGETHAWAIQGQALGANAPAAAAANLANLRSQLQSAQANALPSGPAQTAQLLSSLATTYQATLDAKARLYQSVAGVIEVRLPSLVRASTRLEVETALGVVTYVRPAGIGLHVDH